MDIKQELKDAKNRRQKVVDEVNELAANIEQIQAKRQLLLQEALRLDGEVRLLERLGEGW
jgi:hypothetical protein